MKKFLKILGVCVALLLLLAICLLTINDQQPLEDTDFYPKTLSELNALKIDGGYGKTISSGWSKENITPDFEVNIAGYGLRWKPAAAIHDSIYVRSLVLDNGKQKVAMVTMDLLIVPPLVVEQILPALKQLGFNRNNLYFGATHAHSSAGGWAGGLGGWAMAGPESEKMIKKIADAIIKSVTQALASASVCKIGFQKINAADYVSNRLFGETATEDPWLRIMKIEKENKETALVLTYAAHPTDIPKRDNRISADYPGMLVNSLEQSGACKFAAFFAGAVGSMRPTDNGFESYKKAEIVSSNLENLVKASSIKTDTTSLLSSVYFPLALRDPQLRISKDIRIRPWVFNWLMGKQQIGMNALRIGDMVWIGTPCDYSGMLYNANEAVAEKINKDLVITSFNGGYAGYITPDQYYNEHKSETQEMNWFGPYNGRYFKEVVNKLLIKAGK